MSEQQQQQQQQQQQNQNFSDFFIPFTFVIRPQSQQTQQPSQDVNDQQTSPTAIHFFVYPASGTEGDAQIPPFIFFAPFFVPQENRKHVSESAMKKLPIIEIMQEQIDAQATCPICLEAFSLSSNKEGCQSDDEKSADKETSSLPQSVRQMPCKHIFCESCLFQWLKQNNTCPLCRKEIESEDTSQQPPNEQTTAENTTVSSQEDMTTNDASLSTSTTESNNSFTHFSHTHTSHHQQESINCALESVGCCGESYNNEEPHTASPLITLPQCHHRFHASCLRTSLTVEGYSFESQTSRPLDFYCPTCRSPAIIQSDVLKAPSANLPSQQSSSLPNIPIPPNSDRMEVD